MSRGTSTLGHRRLTQVRSLGRLRYRVALIRQSWLIGVCRDFVCDAWMLHFGPLKVRLWSARR